MTICSSIAYQTEYHEATRTNTYMQLHRNKLPQGATGPPRSHTDIVSEFQSGLQAALQVYHNDVQIGRAVDEQPEAAAPLLAYRVIDDGHFTQRSAEWTTGAMSYWTFPDIFDNLPVEEEEEEEEETDGEDNSPMTDEEEGMLQEMGETVPEMGEDVEN